MKPMSPPLISGFLLIISLFLAEATVTAGLFQDWPRLHAAQADAPTKTVRREEAGVQETTPKEKVEFSLEELVIRMVSGAEQAAQTLTQRFDFALSGLQGAGQEISLVLERMTGGADAGRLLAAMGLASVPFLLGFAVERAYAARLRPVAKWMAGPTNVPLFVLPRVLGFGVLHLSRILVFILAALAMIVLILPDGGLSRQLALFFALPVLRLRIILLAV